MNPDRTYRVLVDDVSDRTRRRIVHVDRVLAIGDQILAFGRDDAQVQYVQDNCPPDFDQWVEVLVLDDGVIE